MHQFVHSGPKIPSEVLYALEEERLVFFCGAGVSVYTGLPDFRQLTIAAFKACNLTLAEERLAARQPYDYAFHEQKYDKALGLLEQEATPGSMRRTVVDLLSTSIPETLPNGPYIHRALLDLSRHRDGGHLLVTTNYDDRFTLAGVSDNLCHAAPRLAPPRCEDWRQLTYLHGRIDRERDPDGRGLLITSADFGKAYLRDGWAARFVVELFREFTVLFIGYGLNDPAMAYLIDALAADMGPKRQFKRAFALAGFRDDGNDFDLQKKLWKAKNLEFIPVNTGLDPEKPDFRLLNETLLEWARHHRGGLDSREADALTNTHRPFIAGNDDEEVKKVAWALSEADGIVARKFAEADPLPHISWLKPLSEVDIPRRDSNDVFRLFQHLAGTGNCVCENGLPLDRASCQLARWLVRHLDKRELVGWIVEHGPHIHPAFAREIERALAEHREPPSPSRAFWELIICGAFNPASGLENLRACPKKA